MNEKNDDIFHLKLDQGGVQYILKTSRVLNIILLLSILFSISGIVGGVIQLRLTEGLVYPGNDLLSFCYRTYPYWLFVYHIFFIVQLFWFWKFNGALKTAVSNMNDAMLNRSFALLYNYSKSMVIVLILSLIGNAMNLAMLLAF